MLDKLLIIKKSRVRRFRSAIRYCDDQIIEIEQKVVKISKEYENHITNWRTYSNQCIGEADYSKLQEIRSELRGYFDKNVNMGMERHNLCTQIEMKKKEKESAIKQLNRGIKEEEKLLYIIEKGM
ncbi:hypothetical protein D5952_14135 [Salmonella enterica subsp. enterica]|nr:hypothetical protein [Salmonella enterica subsp. enterica serovar Bonn]EBZ5939320.1 hypothetical protein [Salmonella enterica subsp. enterica serovar Muenchen]MLZ41063.1 hypothetical protein [Salmonella enterica subsp. enterica serovar Bonn]